MDGDGQGQSIYVLYGVAGIGKSTVAKTLAERAAEANVLGASFFFSRNEDNRKTARLFFPTLANHLARYDDTFARHVNKVLEDDPDAAGRDIRKQFDSLIARPLRLATVERKLPVLIVIDALDECEENGATTILTLLAYEIPKIPRLKVLITARPERHIRSALVRYRDHTQFHMQNIEHSVVEADIHHYLDFRLSEQEVRNAIPELQTPPWRPTEEQVKMLVGISGKLFIIARTAAEFILDSKHAQPAKRIATLLHGVSPTTFLGSKHATIMGNVYMQIIRAAQPDPANDWVHLFQTIVGAIVLLQDPLPRDALADLLGVNIDEIIGTLSNLHSLLAPTQDDYIFRVHHKSFPDFICDRDRCKSGPEFYIDPLLHHMVIATRCLHVMCNNLKLNTCNVPWSECSKDQAELHNRFHNSIARHLAYACIYWASHLVAGLDPEVGWNNEVNALLEDFATRQLLNWMEVLSIIGRIDTAFKSLEMIHAAMVCGFLPTLVKCAACKYSWGNLNSRGFKLVP